ncbi:MAG: hypothetical protein ACRDHB_03560 [Actinomycetota bacterium]
MVMATAGLLLGCAEASEPRDSPQALQDVTADPSAFDDAPVRLRAAYFSSFEVSVLTAGFAESHPPQPVEPLVWVVASPPDRCVERAAGAAWADVVVAWGTFRYDPEGGFGHLGEYEMTLQDATLKCG